MRRTTESDQSEQGNVANQDSLLNGLVRNGFISETETDVPLPPPKAAAKTLKSKSLETVQRWHEQFSGVHKKLALGYNYLQHCKKVRCEFALLQVMIDMMLTKRRVRSTVVFSGGLQRYKSTKHGGEKKRRRGIKEKRTATERTN